MKTAIFIHCARLGIGEPIIIEQLLRLESAGLIELADHIFIGFVGPEHSPDAVELNPYGKEVFSWFLRSPKVQAAYHPDVTTYEAFTLKALREYGQENDAKILYMHSKGATKPTLAKHAWREMFNYFLVDKHKMCLSLLDKYDGVGCNGLNSIIPPTYDKHYFFFGGNFYWTRSSYVRTLPEVVVPPPDRFWCEYWIAMAQRHRFLVLFQPTFDIHALPLRPENYRGEIHAYEHCISDVNIEEVIK